MKVLVLIALVLTVSCQAEEVSKKEKTPYDFKCTYGLEDTFSGKHGIRRCENKEVVCYIIGSGDKDGHSSCKFKK